MFAVAATRRQQDDSLQNEERNKRERLYKRIFSKLPVYALEHACVK